jgi:hypothetical protein
MTQCTTHHHACDCREDAIKECITMLKVYLGSMKTRIIPAIDSQCGDRVRELILKLDPDSKITTYKK